MPIQQYLTSGLKHCHEARELLPGEAYVVRFKNPMREYKTDIWMGIIFPVNDSPGSRLHRRPKGAKPENGPWTTPLSERVYPVYMPGRNSYRWAPANDLFVLEKQPPACYADASDREGAEVFRQIHKIARKKPGLLFWEKMAEEETHTKGKRSRTLELIIPDGFQDALEEGQEEDGGPSTPANERTSTGAIDLEGDEVMQSSSSSAHDRPTTSSRPSGTSEVGNLALAIRNQVPVSFPGENSSFLSYVTRGELGQPSDTNQASGSSDRITAFPLFTPRHRGSLGSTGASGTIRTKTEDDSQPEPDNERTGIFDLTLRDALEYIFLQKDEAADILAVFNDSVLVQNRPESEQIKSFITSGEFVPRIVQVNDPTRNTNAADGNEPSGDSADLQVGDRHGFGRRYQLQGINNSDDLGKHIISLGHLYRQARRFNLVALINMITLKLQVAWNSYPGLSQLEPLLEVVSMAFQNNSDDNKDQLQAWLISFMADTLDLIYFACSGRFWEVMQGNSALQRAVFAARSDIVAKNPEKYSDARVLIRSRGIDRV